MKRTPIIVKPQPWNYERVELLKSLWNDGHSAAEIARTLGGVSRNAVLGKVHRLNLDGRAVSNRCQNERQRHPRRPSPEIVRRPRLNCDQLKDIHDLANEPEACLTPDEKYIGSLEITSTQCHWPHGDPIHDPDFHFCANSILAGSPYCPHHSSRAWDRKGTEKSKLKAKAASEAYAQEQRKAA